MIGGNFMLILIVFIALTFAVVASWYLWATHEISIFSFLSPEHMNNIKYDTTGTWGDTFGALNTLFAGLGFVGIIITILLQIKAGREQKKDNHKQVFEESIFKLIDIIVDHRKNIIFFDEDKNKKYLGAKAFKALDEKIRREINKFRNDNNKEFPKKDILLKIYNDNFHSKYESRVSSYFRIVNYTFNKIKNDKFLDDQEKISYANLIRGQLTSYEVSIIGVNGLANYSGNMFHIVEEFRLLRYAKKNTYLTQNLKIFYHKIAFSQRNKE